MKNKAYDISSYQFTASEEILIDTNIWLYLFPAPTGKVNRLASTYSQAFKALNHAGAKPVIDPIIMSEYLNRYCRLEWQVRFQRHFSDYKKFRTSVDFIPLAQDAVKFANTIMRICKMNDVHINSKEMKQALIEFQTGSIDFNDALLISLCKKNQYKLMTNDSDFNSGGIDILTSNPKLLADCQV